MADVPPQDSEILNLIGQGIKPSVLIQTLSATHTKDNVIEALQRAIEREKITLNSDGMVVLVQQLAEVA